LTAQAKAFSNFSLTEGSCNQDSFAGMLEVAGFITSSFYD
jgi:hypothetical protein